MKKILLPLALSVFTFYAQAQRGSGWLLGFEFNPSYYTMLNEADKNADPFLTLKYDNPTLLEAPRAWALGVKAVYNFTEQIGLQTGLRYSWGRQDYTYRVRNSDVRKARGSIRTELNYIQVPVMFTWSPKSEYHSRFYASAGLAPAVLVWYYEQNSYLDETSNGLWYDEVVYTYKNNERTLKANKNGEVIYNYTNYRGMAEYRMYNLFNLFVAAEVGMRFALQGGWQFQVAVNYYQSLLNPDNIEGKLWDWDKYTRNEYPVQTSGEEPPTKYERPKTTLLYVGVSLGLIYDFNW